MQRVVPCRTSWAEGREASKVAARKLDTWKCSLLAHRGREGRGRIQIAKSEMKRRKKEARFPKQSKQGKFFFIL